MPTPEAIAADLRLLIEPGARERLVARGLARGMVWRNGVLPEAAAHFAGSLTSDLLDHGYLVLATTLRLRDASGDSETVRDGFRVAAECIESAVRRAELGAERRGENLVIAAAAFHLARLGARSYSLLARPQDTERVAVGFSALGALMRRDLKGLADTIREWLNDRRHTDAGVADAMEASFPEEEADDSLAEDMGAPGYGIDDAIAIALTRSLLRGVARFVFALHQGDHESFEQASATLRAAEAAAGKAHFVSIWWAAVLARHLCEELWIDSLHQRIPSPPSPNGEPSNYVQLRKRFIQVLASRDLAEIDLWPSQHEAALRSLDPGDDLVVALPTSAGKTRIAELCILRALASDRRVVYVTPLRALSAQIERGLGRTFRPLGFTVSSLYGASGVTVADVAALRSASIVVSTPEKLDFSIRQDPSLLDDVALIVLDEGHMIGEGEREVRYEVLVQRLLRRADAGERRLVCLSAIFEEGDSFEDFTSWLRSDDPGTPITSKWRPTRQRTGFLRWNTRSARLDLEVHDERPFVQHFVRAQPAQAPRRRPFPSDGQELTIAAALALVGEGQRVLVYCPLKKSVESHAKVWLTLVRQGFTASLLPNRDAIESALVIAEEWLGTAHVATQALQMGIGVHHGSLPRPFLSAIERLLSARALPVVIASPTVAQGLDLSCSALILQSIHRAGERLKPGEYANVVGRAGRAFVDLDGLTIYPIWETGRKGAWKKSEFDRLRAESRQMESGILSVLRELAMMLGTCLGQPWHEVLQHAADLAAPWGALTRNDTLRELQAHDGKAAKEAARKEEERLVTAERLLADLDTVLLSTIENLECAEADLADALDQALASSLYRRRIDRGGDLMRNAQHRVLLTRARWLWISSTASERRSWFNSGIGYAAGRHLNGHLHELTRLIGDCDEALLRGEVAEAADALCAVAETLLQVHPFSQKGLHPMWSELLSRWIAGESTSTLVQRFGGECLDTIQQAFVYRFVWGVEAVRVQAAALAVPGAERLTGETAMALTYGLPNRQACLLAQAGLVSRRMAVAALERCPGDFSTLPEMLRWVNRVAAEVEALWEDAPSRDEWKEFVAGVTATVNARWTETRSTARVAWTEGATAPVPGEAVQLVRDRETGTVSVYDTTMQRVGVIESPFETRVREHLAAVAGRFPNTVEVLRYGPPAAQA